MNKIINTVRVRVVDRVGDVEFHHDTEGAHLTGNILESHYGDFDVETTDEIWRRGMLRVVALYSDGGVLRPRKCEVGSFAWIGVDAEGNRVLSQRGWIEESPTFPEGVSNNVTEFAAMLKALEEVSKVVPGWSGKMCSDSGITIGRFSQGWKMLGIPDRWQHRLGAVLRNIGHVEYVLHKGHPTKAELEAGEGTRARSGKTYPVSIHQVDCDAMCGKTLKEWIELNDPR